MTKSYLSRDDVALRRTAPLQTPSDLGSDAASTIAVCTNLILADVFALYIKTKNFH